MRSPAPIRGKKSESDDEEGEINPLKKNPTQKQSHSESEATSGVESQLRAEKDDINMFLASESEGEEENDDGDKSDDDGWLAEMAELTCSKPLWGQER